jgi:transcriptional regulator with XRE-family HTH domain
LTVKDSVLTGTAGSGNPDTPTGTADPDPADPEPADPESADPGPADPGPAGSGPAGSEPAGSEPAGRGGGGDSARGDRGADAVTAAVARHVRALRQARGWSLDELSGRSGVSKGMVVQIEAGRTNPSIGILCRISDALGITVARLLEPDAARPVRVSAAASAPVLWRGAGGGIARLLVGRGEPQFVELWEWRLHPGDAHDSPDHAPGTREVLHVLDGGLTVTVDGVDHRVRAAETIDFVADKAHGYRNDSDSLVSLVMVVVMPPGDHDRRR